MLFRILIFIRKIGAFWIQEILLYSIIKEKLKGSTRFQFFTFLENSTMPGPRATSNEIFRKFGLYKIYIKKFKKIFNSLALKLLNLCSIADLDLLDYSILVYNLWFLRKLPSNEPSLTLNYVLK